MHSAVQKNLISIHQYKQALNVCQKRFPLGNVLWMYASLCQGQVCSFSGAPVGPEACWFCCADWSDFQGSAGITGVCHSAGLLCGPWGWPAPFSQQVLY